MHNFFHSAMLAVAVIKSGQVGIAGATRHALDRALLGLRTLIQGALSEVRLTVGPKAPVERTNLAEFIAHVQVSGGWRRRRENPSLSSANAKSGASLAFERGLRVT